MKWSDLLATLSTQTECLSFSEFAHLSQFNCLENPPQILSEIRSPRLRNFLKNNPGWFDIGLKALNKMKGRYGLTYPGCENYPDFLLRCEEPPLFISTLGDLQNCHTTVRVGLVGSREARVETLCWLDHQAQTWIEPGVSIVSGGARGIDQKAHGLAILHNIPTYVFLPSGLSRLYPTSLNRWIEPVLACGGAFVSEFLPDMEMRKYHFLKRNRTLSLFSSFVFVAQSQRGSGSQMTARCTTELGKEVCVLPGFPSDPLFQGNLDLLASGAVIIRSGLDLRAMIVRHRQNNHL